MTLEDDQTTSLRLLDRASTGDRAAVEELLVLHLPDVRAFVRLRIDPLLRTRESAEDIVQSVCREVLERASRIEVRSEESFRHWLYGAVLNKVRDKRDFHLAQRRTPSREVPASTDALGPRYASLVSPSAEAIAREEIERIETAFDELPEHYREVISLAKIARLRSPEIGKAMRRSEKAVRGLLSRALARLATALARSA